MKENQYWRKNLKPAQAGCDPSQTGQGEKRQPQRIKITTIWRRLLCLPIDQFIAVTGIRLTGPVADEMRRHGSVMADAVAGSAIVRAIQGDNKALEFLLDRIDGKLAQEFLGDPNRPIIIVDYKKEVKAVEAAEFTEQKPEPENIDEPQQ